MPRQLLVCAAIAASLSISPFCAHAVTRNNEALALQVSLDRAGFSPGVIDGTMGRLTQEAIKGFQEAKGIAVTGRLDAETKTALGEPTAATETVCCSMKVSNFAGTPDLSPERQPPPWI